MPAAPAKKRRRVGLLDGTVALSVQPIQRQLEEIKRQRARADTAKVPLEQSKAPGAGHVRLTAANGVAARRLGVPLRALPSSTAGGPSNGSGAAAPVAVHRPPARWQGGGHGSDSSGAEEEAQPLSVGSVSGAQSSTRRQRPRLDSRVATGDSRGRKIVGSLLGHLASARQQLVDERRIPHAQVAALAAAAPVPGRKEKRRTRLTDQCTEEEEEKAQDIDRAIQEKEMLLLQQRLEGHYMHMKNFIRTKVEPTIFYLPVKHTPETEQFLEETRMAIEQKIRSLKTHLQCPQGTCDTEVISDASEEGLSETANVEEGEEEEVAADEEEEEEDAEEEEEEEEEGQEEGEEEDEEDEPRRVVQRHGRCHAEQSKARRTGKLR